MTIVSDYHRTNNKQSNCKYFQIVVKLSLVAFLKIGSKLIDEYEESQLSEVKGAKEVKKKKW